MMKSLTVRQKYYEYSLIVTTILCKIRKFNTTLVRVSYKLNNKCNYVRLHYYKILTKIF